MKALISVEYSASDYERVIAAMHALEIAVKRYDVLLKDDNGRVSARVVKGAPLFDLNKCKRAEGGL